MMFDGFNIDSTSKERNLDLLSMGSMVLEHNVQSRNYRRIINPKLDLSIQSLDLRLSRF